MTAVTFNAGQWLVDRHVDGGGGSVPCLRTADGEHTYGDVLDRVDRFGGLLASAGVARGDRILIVLPDSVVAVVALLGVIRSGAVAIPLSPRLKPTDYTRIVADCQPHAAVLTGGLAWLLPHLAPHTGDRCWLDDDAGTGRRLCPELAAAAGAGPAPTGPDEIALMQYTSGSTGEPRGVLHRHAALRAAPAGLIELLDVHPSDVLFSASKLAFGYGLGNSVLVPMSLGASSVLVAQPLDASVVARELSRHRPTLFFAVPTLYAALVAGRDVVERFPLRRCRAYVSSGEYLSAALGARCLAAFGPGLVNVFGCTETLYSFAGNAPGDWSPEVIGTPFTGYNLRLESEGADSGELWVRGPGVAAGYWQRPDQTATAFRDGWVCTGDSMRCVGGGLLSYLGRNDDVLKVGGLKVAPAEIEDVLLGHPDVAACAVVGVPDDNGLTRIVAFVVRSDSAAAGSAAASAVDLQRHLHERLTPQRRPAQIQFVDDLPRTPTGKTSRHLLRHGAAASLYR